MLDKSESGSMPQGMLSKILYIRFCTLRKCADIFHLTAKRVKLREKKAPESVREI